MNRRLFNLLGLAAAFLTVAVLVVNWLGPQKPDAVDAEKLLPDFMQERAGVDFIQLSKGNGVPLVLKRDGEHWTVASRDGYPANAGKIRTLLDNLAQAEKVEAKTADPARYEKLGVKADSDQALLLTVKAGEKLVIELVVGNAVLRPAGHFVRMKADAQSWLIDRELSIGTEASDWLRTDLINLPASTIKRVERVKAQPVQCITVPCPPVAGDVLFTLSKEKVEDNSFTLAPIPAGKAPGADWLLAGLADALNGLNASDVLRADRFAFTAAKATFSRYRSFDDQAVLLSHYLKDNRHYVGLQAEAGPTATDAAKVAVEQLNQRHAGWLYEISSYKGEGMSRELNALVQDKAGSK